MTEQTANLFQTTITADMNNTTDPITFNLGASPPSPINTGNWRLLLANTDGTNSEILLVTAVAGAQVTASRAQEGTTKKAHVAATTVATHILTAASLQNKIDDRIVVKKSPEAAMMTIYFDGTTYFARNERTASIDAQSSNSLDAVWGAVKTELGTTALTEANGGVVTLATPSGHEYNLKAPLDIYTGYTVIGPGTGSKIKAVSGFPTGGSDSAPKAMLDASAVGKTNGAGRVRIEGVYVDCNSIAEVGIFHDRPTSTGGDPEAVKGKNMASFVDECHVRGYTRHGLQTSIPGDTKGTANLWVTNTNIHNAGTAASGVVNRKCAALFNGDMHVGHGNNFTSAEDGSDMCIYIYNVGYTFLEGHSHYANQHNQSIYGTVYIDKGSNSRISFRYADTVYSGPVVRMAGGLGTCDDIVIDGQMIHGVNDTEPDLANDLYVWGAQVKRYTVSGIVSQGGNIYRFQTNAAHTLTNPKLPQLRLCSITNVSVGGYNGRFFVTNVPDNTHVDVDIGSAPGGSPTGGVIYLQEPATSSTRYGQLLNIHGEGITSSLRFRSIASLVNAASDPAPSFLMNGNYVKNCQNFYMGNPPGTMGPNHVIDGGQWNTIPYTSQTHAITDADFRQPQDGYTGTATVNGRRYLYFRRGGIWYSVEGT